MKLFVFLCVLLGCFQAAAARAQHRSTEDLRELWKAYECNESSMVTLMVNESDPKNTALVMVHRKAAEAFRSLHGVMEHFGFAPSVPLAQTGGYACSKNKSSGKLSLHAYGIAADYDWDRNKYQSASTGKLVTTMDDAMIAAIEAIQTKGGEQVFRWGGRYVGHRSPMHFEIIVSPKALELGISEINLQLRAGFNLGSLINMGRRALSGGTDNNNSSGGSRLGGLLQQGLSALGNRGGKLGKIANVLQTVTQPGSIADKISAVAGALGPKGQAIGSVIDAVRGPGTIMDKIGAIAPQIGQLTNNNKVNAITQFVGNAANNGGVPNLDSVKDLVGALRGQPGAQIPSSGNPNPTPTFTPATGTGAPIGTTGTTTGTTTTGTTTTGAPTGTNKPGVITGVIPANPVLCDSFTCPAGQSYKLGLIPSMADCGAACDAVKCCSHNQKCGAISCGPGTEHRNKQFECSSSACSQNECCVALPAKDCSTFTCPPRHHLRANAAAIDCPLGACTDPQLCCAVSALCSSHVCAAGSGPKPTPPSSCKGAVCAPEECCDVDTTTGTTTASAGGKCADVQCGARTPLATAATVKCAAAQCTLDECCAPASTTTPTNGGKTPPKKNINHGRDPPDVDTASFGGKDGRLPDAAKDRPFEDTEVNGMLVAGAAADDDDVSPVSGKRTPAAREAARAAAARAAALAAAANEKKKGSSSSGDDTAKILMIVGIAIGSLCLLIGAGFGIMVVKRRGQSDLRGAQGYYRHDATPLGGSSGGRMQPAVGHGSASGARMPEDQFEAQLPSSLNNYSRNPASISVAVAGGLDNQDFYRQGRLYSDVDDGYSTRPANLGV